MMNNPVRIFLILLSFLLGTEILFAHGYKMTLRQEGSLLKGHISGLSQRDAQAAKVRVENKEGVRLTELSVNLQRQFILDLRGLPKQLGLFLITGDGHSAFARFNNSFASDSSSESPAQDSNLATEQALLKQIKALQTQLEALEARNKIQDIVGGLGYFFALIGGALYLKSKSKGGK